MGLSGDRHVSCDDIRRMRSDIEYGTRTADLDNDGDFDIVNICWLDANAVYVFRNDSESARTVPVMTSTKPVPRRDGPYRIRILGADGRVMSASAARRIVWQFRGFQTVEMFVNQIKGDLWDLK